ncbi:MAG: GNAT family N-acetyltransferase [Colwellia sp.]|nr:GNAT family N-acetyltransferase [Colwellia sp.]MCW8865491.1 GNAT family N-acetyltransferase [Colwellia sp.]MCW9080715.1 GNAT family N-acetyltransferase [Colwellia sp.]
MIRPANLQDAQNIANIYNYYVKNTVITFEEDCIDSKEMARRIKKVTELNLPWLVIEENEILVGYAYATPWRARSAYRFSVEATVYLNPDQQGKGLGTQLYQALFSALKQQSIHAIIGGITLPNPASIALHEKLGMTKGF